MMPTVLHAVARKAEAATPDAELLARFVRDRDDRAFEELVRRHGPLVWAVCRQVLSSDADAEDAFQAVFLTLARCAANIRDARAVSAWLHGAAVRVATRARRGIARRQARERRAAVPEADRPVSDAAWAALVAAVHEEVQRLPAAERAAFVLCDLQGVAQADAAARLGWPLGSVSARLCTARRRLLDRLAARGVAPAALVGVGATAGAAAAVPVPLFDTVKTFPAAPLAASSGAAALARGLTEGVTMRVKLAAVATVVVAALGATGGAMWLAKADAQPPGTGGSGGSSLGPPPGTAGSPFGRPPGPGGTTGFAPMGGSSLGPPPGMGGSSLPPPATTGAPPRSGPTSGGVSFVRPEWEHKFVDVKSDRKEFEKVIIQHGKDGWEFCTAQQFAFASPMGGPSDLTLVFKRRKGDAGATGGMGTPMGPTPPGTGRGPGTGGDSTLQSFRLKNLKAADAAERLQKILAGWDVKVTADTASNSVLVSGDPATVKQLLDVVEKMIADADAKPAPTGGSAPGSGMGMPPAPMGAGSTPGKPMPPATLTIFTLKNAKAAELAKVVEKVFAPQGVEVTADPRTNQLIVRSDDDAVPAITRIIEQLDVSVPK